MHESMPDNKVELSSLHSCIYWCWIVV